MTLMCGHLKEGNTEIHQDYPRQNDKNVKVNNVNL